MNIHTSHLSALIALALLVAFLLGTLVSTVLPNTTYTHHHDAAMHHPMLFDETGASENETVLLSSLQEQLMGDLLREGKYACCLKEPCVTCLTLTPWHGEGASCTCLADVVNGAAPCGECVGGILGGRGNPYLAQYFAASLAEELGAAAQPLLQEKMEVLYDIPVAEQV